MSGLGRARAPLGRGGDPPGDPLVGRARAATGAPRWARGGGPGPAASTGFGQLPPRAGPSTGARPCGWPTRRGRSLVAARVPVAGGPAARPRGRPSEPGHGLPLPRGAPRRGAARRVRADRMPSPTRPPPIRRARRRPIVRPPCLVRPSPAASGTRSARRLEPPGPVAVGTDVAAAGRRRRAGRSAARRPRRSARAARVRVRGEHHRVQVAVGGLGVGDLRGVEEQVADDHGLLATGGDPHARRARGCARARPRCGRPGRSCSPPSTASTRPCVERGAEERPRPRSSGWTPARRSSSSAAGIR